MTASTIASSPLLFGFVDFDKVASRSPLVIERGEGVKVYDQSGGEYIDAVSGFFCISLGYSEPLLVEAATKQLEQLPYLTNAMCRTSEPALVLADKLASLSPIPNAKVCYANSGSEAVDYALKFAYFRSSIRRNHRGMKVISRSSSYHGSTVRTSRNSGVRAANINLGLPVDDVIEISQPDWTGPECDNDGETAFCAELLDELEQVLSSHDGKHASLFLGEPVSFSAGIAIPPSGYWSGVRSRLSDAGVDFLDDEVCTGFGRMGRFFAIEEENVVPDMIVCAKGLTSAYQPLAALILSERIYDELREAVAAKQGVFPHASTTAGNPVACAVALKTIEIIEDRKILDHVQALAPYFRSALESLVDHALVQTIRTTGFCGHVELTVPSGFAVSPNISIAETVQAAGYVNGVITRPRGDRSLFTPPLIMTEEEIDEMVARYRDGLDLVLAQLRKTN